MKVIKKGKRSACLRLRRNPSPVSNGGRTKKQKQKKNPKEDKRKNKTTTPNTKKKKKKKGELVKRKVLVTASRRKITALERPECMKGKRRGPVPADAESS